MTIKDLYSLLKDKCPQVFRNQPVTIFSKRRVAVDAYLYLFAAMAVAQKKAVDSTDVTLMDVDRGVVLNHWLTDMLEFVCRWLSYDVTPVFVFDGDHLPEKEETRAKRRLVREKSMAELAAIRKEIESLDILARPPPLVTKYRKLLYTCFSISTDEISLAKNLLGNLGIPVLQAKNDAEQLCSILCKEGKVAAVHSRDGDNLAYGCPFLITEFTGKMIRDPAGNRVHEVVVLNIDEILGALALTQEQFTDLCILLGCDFNSNIPFIGKVAAFNLIKKFESIDRLPRITPESSMINPDRCSCKLSKKRDYDLQILKHARCREIFSPSGSAGVCAEEDYQDRMAIRRNLAETGRDLLSSYNLLNFITKLTKLFTTISDPTGEKIVLTSAQVIDDATGLLISAQEPGTRGTDRTEEKGKGKVLTAAETESVVVKLNRLRIHFPADNKPLIKVPPLSVLRAGRANTGGAGPTEGTGGKGEELPVQRLC